MKSLLTIVASVLLIASMGLSQSAYGQNKKKDQKEKGELLPSINPGDIEIQGQYTTQFGGLRRQPILGFRPSHEVIPINPNRTPFMGNGPGAASSIPIAGLNAPMPPRFTPLQRSKSNTTFLRFGYGNYQSIQTRFRGAYPMADSSSYLGLGLDMSSSGGHLNNRLSSFRFLNARANYGTQINPGLDFNLHAGIQNDFHYPAIFNLTSTTKNYRISDKSIYGGVSLSGAKNAVSWWKLKADLSKYKTAYEANSTAKEIQGMVFKGSFMNQWGLAQPNQTISLKVGGRAGNYGSPNQKWGTVYGGVQYKQLFNYQTHLEIGAKVYYISDIKKSKATLGGLLKVDHWFANHLKVTGKIQAEPYIYTLKEFHHQNRFLGVQSQLIHTYAVNVTGKAQIKYYRGSKLHFGVRYSNYQDYAYFTPSNTYICGFIGPCGRVIKNHYTVNYEDATNFRLFAGITQQLLPERFWLTAKVYLQHPELANSKKIPFKENWGFRASATVRPIDRISLEAWANFTGKRHTGIADEKVDGFLLVGAQLDLNITENIGIYGKLVNILNTHYQYWPGYQERPFQAFGGITIKF